MQVLVVKSMINKYLCDLPLAFLDHNQYQTQILNLLAPNPEMFYLVYSSSMGSAAMDEEPET